MSINRDLVKQIIIHSSGRTLCRVKSALHTGQHWLLLTNIPVEMVSSSVGLALSVSFTRSPSSASPLNLIFLKVVPVLLLFYTPLCVVLSSLLTSLVISMLMNPNLFFRPHLSHTLKAPYSLTSFSSSLSHYVFTYVLLLPSSPFPYLATSCLAQSSPTPPPSTPPTLGDGGLGVEKAFIDLLPQMLFLLSELFFLP